MLRMHTTWLDGSSPEAHMGIVTKFVVPGTVFLLTLASGLWLSRAGKPLNRGILSLEVTA